MTPAEDPFPPILHSDEWREPIPVPGPINTAGGEDSPFITPDGKTLTFFFTPDVTVPAERQVVDGVTGIYLSHLVGGGWTEPVRLWLQEPDEPALDGCLTIQGDTLWFCSARAGNLREIDLWQADFDGRTAWSWRNAGERLNVDLLVGEMHITREGDTIFYHSNRNGGMGDLDLWVTHLRDGEWSPAENIAEVNTEVGEGWPFVTQDGAELWFLRWFQGYPAIFRARRVQGGWSDPELILSQFAAEPTLDNEGNIYFAHHFIENGVMIEADIYVAYRK
jgi:hypothetical protein